MDGSRRPRRACAARSREPGRGAWHRALSMIVTHRQRDADIEAMQRLIVGSAAPDDACAASFGLGKALDDLGEYAKAPTIS